MSGKPRITKTNWNNFLSSFGFQLSLGFLIILFIFSALSLFNHHLMELLAQKEAEQRELLERQQTAMSLTRLVERMDAAAATQDTSVRKIAAEAATIHIHAESLFQELSKFRT